MSKVWIKGGKVIASRDTGNIIVCDECPCYGETDDCSYCSGGTSPTHFRVEIDGVVKKSGGPCTTALCSTWNGSYVAVRDDDAFGTPGCEWYLQVTESLLPPFFGGDCDTCDLCFIWIRIYEDGVGGYDVIVTAGRDTLGQSEIQWIKNYASLPECVDFDEEDIPYDNSVGDCGSNAATCKLTAL